MRVVVTGPNLPGALEDMRAFCRLHKLAYKVSAGLPGRPRRQVPVQNVLDALASGKTVTATARALGISRAMVYRLMATVRGVSR